MDSFTIDAVITDGDALRHYRDRDHNKTQGDTHVVVDAAFGWYEIGTTLDVVLADLWDRSVTVE